MDVVVLARRAAVLVASVLVVTSCASPPEQVVQQSFPSSTAMASETVPPPSAPVRLQVSSIELDEPLIGLGLTDDGGMEVPSDYDDVGWFTGGGRPFFDGTSGFGPTVLAGHVDSTTGPAVFDRLDDVEIGELVTLSAEGGGVANYRVTRVGDYAKAEFPTAEVFGATVDDEVRLITCSGDFDSAVGSYEQNFVVFAVRIQ